VPVGVTEGAAAEADSTAELITARELVRAGKIAAAEEDTTLELDADESVFELEATRVEDTIAKLVTAADDDERHSTI
jgi:hypothetical protein